jgi:predicted permease
MNFLLIALCLVAGIILRTTGVVPENSHKGINTWILYVALPAMSLLYIPTLTWSPSLLLPLAMPLLVWAGAWLTVKLYAKRFELDKRTHAALLLTAGLGNTSFIGFPLTQAYLGDHGLRIAVICDQANFIALSVLGVMTALKASEVSGPAKSGVFRALVRFPPFTAFVAALVLPRFVSFAPVDPLLTKLAGTLVPLALFSVGLQIHLSGWKKELPALSLGLGYKLVIAPALVFCAALAFHIKGVAAQASVFEAAMAPMVTSAILASEYQLNPRLSNLMVSVGTLLSLATTALWYPVLRAMLA